MFFAGTDKLSKQDIGKEYSDIGGANAMTSKDDIIFTGTMLSRKLGKFLTIVQDLICNSTFASDAIEEEKKIIIRLMVKWEKDQIDV